MKRITPTQKRFSNEWLTLFEKSSQQKSPSYRETISYFKKFVDKTPYAKMFTIGISPQGREIKCLVVAGNEEFTPEKAKRSGMYAFASRNSCNKREIQSSQEFSAAHNSCL